MRKPNRKTKGYLDPAWQQSPEWRKKVDTVNKLKCAGYGEEQIAAVTLYPPIEVRRIIEDDLEAQKYAKSNFDQQLPVMKDIVGMGLKAIQDALKELLIDPELRRRALGRICDVKDLTKIVVELNSLIRLDQGQSTQNIAVSRNNYQETRVILQELKKIDPVFSYPELPDVLAPKPDEN